MKSSTTWNPRPTNAPYTAPSTTLLTCRRAISTTITTPSVLSDLLDHRARRWPAPQAAAKAGDTSLASRSRAAPLPAIAVVVADHAAPCHRRRHQGGGRLALQEVDAPGEDHERHRVQAEQHRPRPSTPPGTPERAAEHLCQPASRRPRGEPTSIQKAGNSTDCQRRAAGGADRAARPTGCRCGADRGALARARVDRCAARSRASRTRPQAQGCRLCCQISTGPGGYHGSDRRATLTPLPATVT